MLAGKKKKSEGDMAEVDVTPLIDIVFLLLIFMIVVVLTAASEVKAELMLPQTRIAAPEEKEGRDQDILIVNLDNTGRVMVMARFFSEPELRTLLANEAKRSMGPDGYATRPVYIRAHRNRPWGEVQDILSICRDVRIWKVTLRVLGEEEDERL